MNLPCETFTQLKEVVMVLCDQFNLITEQPIKGRPRKLSQIDAVTLALYQHTSSRSTKKSVYEDFKGILNCSYKTLVVSMNESSVLCLRLLFLIMRFNRSVQHVVKYTDSTDIPVCLKKNADAHRTMKDFSEIGRSTKGWFYGIKMILARDAQGRMLAIRFHKPSDNDREIFKQINKDIYGIIVADAGYVSKKLEQDMNRMKETDTLKRWVLIRPFKTMKKLMTRWQEELYKGRFQIEFDFRSLKMFHGLVTSLPRSITGYLANYLHALLSFVLSPFR